MIKPEVLDAMLAAGCSAEQIVAAIKADRGAKSSGAARQAKYRANKRDREAATNVDAVNVASDVTLRNGDAADVTHRDIAETVSLSPVPLLSPTPPNNPLTPKPIQKNNSRGTRLPDDWQLSGPDLAYALSKGLTEFETGNLAERFKSWALSASGPNAVKRNWHQAWQGWVQRDGPKIVAARAGPIAKPLTEFQRKQQETNDVRSELRNFANGVRSGGTLDRVLSSDFGERPEGLRGGLGQAVLELPGASGRGGH